MSKDRRSGAGASRQAPGRDFSRTHPAPDAILGPAMKIYLVPILLALGLFAAEEVTPADLAKDLEEKVGQEFTFTDEILLKTKKQELEEYVKFETMHLRCILSKNRKEEVDLLETLLAERAPRRATITGTVTRQKDLQVFVEVTAIERPRYKRRGAP